VLPEGELAVKRDSKESWSLGVGHGGTVDGDRKLTAGFPIIQVEHSACSFGCAQPGPPCSYVFSNSLHIQRKDFFYLI